MTKPSRWEPLSRAMSLREAMNRLLEAGVFPLDLPWNWEATGTFALDMYETDDAFVVKAAVPGIKPEDIEIDISNNVLSIRGESREEEKVEGARYHRLERRYGRFERTVVLPTRTDIANVDAVLKDGILTLTIPKLEEAKPIKITVKVST